MKVSNNKVGGGLGTGDAGKTGKADATNGLKKETKAGALDQHAGIKNSSQVNVSERAQMMQKAKELAGSPMTVDETKVARLQKLIDEGKYKVDAESIADRLVDEHLAIPDWES
jgi:negative regulator of flagellin synthesis FlgM